MTEFEWEATDMAKMILLKAIGKAYRDMVDNWNPYKELGFVMVRRALRHLSLGDSEMY